MGQDRVDISIARIERALTRIEAAAARGPAPPPAGEEADEDLRRAHQALRGKVESAIAELDGLLATGREQG